MIRKYIERKKLGDKVEYRGDHCFDNCINGPNMMIGTKLFQKVSTQNVEEYLNEGLSDL